MALRHLPISLFETDSTFLYLIYRALFDSDDESGSVEGMDVDEFPASKKKASGKASAVPSKYAKKASGFTDDNAEWLTLKKEVRSESGLHNAAHFFAFKALF